MGTAVFVHETDPGACERLEGLDLIGIDCVLKNTRDHRAEDGGGDIMCSLVQGNDVGLTSIEITPRSRLFV